MKEYLNQQDMKDSNLNNVFHLLLKEKQMTRRQIEAATHLSWGAVSNVTSLLVRLGYIKEVKAENPGAGRTPALLEVNDAEHYIIGVDINTSGFRAVLVNLKNEAVYTTQSTPRCDSREEMLECIIHLIHDVLDYADNGNVLCIGIAMQGQVDAQKGVSVHFASCEGWADVPLAQILEDKLGVPVFLEHDPNCILYACSLPRQLKEAILIRIDNGIGMAVMMDGKIFDRCGAFELGHTVAVPGGASCSCGNQGCLEAYATRNGLAALAGMPFEELADRVRNHQMSDELFRQMAGYLGIAVANTAKLLNIAEIVVCGDMLLYKDLFWHHFVSCAAACHPEKLQFSATEVDNAAIGAALIAIERYTLTIQ